MSNVHYIIKVIEPDKEYMKTFIHPKLDICKQYAQEYLWSCPEKTKYIVADVRLKNE